MSHCGISQILFSEIYTVPAEQTSQRMFGVLPHGKSYADGLLFKCDVERLPDRSAYESICVREMQTHLDHSKETIVVASMQCQYRAPIPPGALVTVDGWVIGIGEGQGSQIWGLGRVTSRKLCAKAKSAS